MKDLLRVCAALAAMMLLACCGHNEGEEQQKPVEEPKGPQPGEYSFVMPSDMKVNGEAMDIGHLAWKEGDKICLHSGYGPATQILSVKASEISADGKTATINLETIPIGLCEPDWLYAAYPGDWTEISDGFADAGTVFSRWDGLLMAAYLQENSFKFAPASGALAFSVTGDFDSLIVCESKWAELFRTSYSLEYSSEKSSFDAKKALRDRFLTLPVHSGEINYAWFPGGIDFKKGISFYFKKGTNYSMVYSYDGAVSIKRGEIFALGDITSFLKPFAGQKPEMPEMPKMSSEKPVRYAIKTIPEMSGLCLSADKNFIWAVGDEGQLGKISFDGTVTKVKHFSTDLEGVTLNPTTGDLIVAIEGSQKVAKIVAPDFTEKKNLFNVQEAIDGKYDNSGLEGITYYKDGQVFVGAQTGGYLWLYSLDGTLIREKVRLRDLATDIQEVAGLEYDPVTDLLWMVDSEAHKIFVFNSDTNLLLARYTLKGIGNPESICVDHGNQCVWIGDDDDDEPALYKFSFTGLDNIPVIPQL